ncbi:hypothetical protein [Mesorhizobium sp. SP-1A]|uniref:hypothetical protein n=1 Tax=Mesorhizobium sp. SP-1A TaxID=3077840 RepID=UPI0028F728B9|nr:hypothetical protein [Mesorhizobium sp. SP-1A]
MRDLVRQQLLAVLGLLFPRNHHLDAAVHPAGGIPRQSGKQGKPAPPASSEESARSVVAVGKSGATSVGLLQLPIPGLVNLDVGAKPVMREEIMFRKVLIATSIMAVFSVPAFAATEYWVAKDATTKKCEVVDKKPDGTKMMDEGKKMYTSKANAEKAMKELASCK